MIALHELRISLPQRMANHPTSALLLVTRGLVPEGFNNHARLRVTSDSPSGPSDCKGVTAILFVSPFDAEEADGFHRWVRATRQSVVIWRSDDMLVALAPVISKALGIVIPVAALAEAPLPTKGSIRFHKEPKERKEKNPRRRKRRKQNRLAEPDLAERQETMAALVDAGCDILRILGDSPTKPANNNGVAQETTPVSEVIPEPVLVEVPAPQIRKKAPDPTPSPTKPVVAKQPGQHGWTEEFVRANVSPDWYYSNTEGPRLLPLAQAQGYTGTGNSLARVVAKLEKSGKIPERKPPPSGALKMGQLSKLVLQHVDIDRAVDFRETKRLTVVINKELEGKRRRTSVGSMRSIFRKLLRRGLIPPAKPRPKPITMADWVPKHAKGIRVSNKGEARRLSRLAATQGYRWAPGSICHILQDLVEKGALPKVSGRGWQDRLLGEIEVRDTRIRELEAEIVKLKGDSPKS